MIGNALRAEIDRYASEMRRSSPIFCKVEDGTLTRAQAQAFLESLRFLGRQTPALLLRARGRATATGDDALAAFYSQALREAEDHESWPTWDIDPVSTGLLETSRGAVPSIGRLLTYLEGMIDASDSLSRVRPLC